MPEQTDATSGIGSVMVQPRQYAQCDVITVGLVAHGIFGFASDAANRLVDPVDTRPGRLGIGLAGVR